MDNLEAGQLDTHAAEVYDEFFVPALFDQWPAPLAERAALAGESRILDVACGTGVLARSLADQLGDGAGVIGLDVNQAMLAVARRRSTRVEWRCGRAEALPFDDASFDAVVSQFGLMFFEDRTAALREMWRVLRPGGRLVVAVWDAVERSPGYAAVLSLLERLFGDDVARALRAPFVLGDPETLPPLFTGAGIPDARVETLPGVARFPSIESWMHTDVRGWTLGDVLDDAQYARLVDAAEVELRRFADDTGRVSFDAPAHVVTATRAH